MIILGKMSFFRESGPSDFFFYYYSKLSFSNDFQPSLKSPAHTTV